MLCLDAEKAFEYLERFDFAENSINSVKALFSVSTEKNQDKQTTYKTV